jgi:probable F420-dependent oxidoreductase
MRVGTFLPHMSAAASPETLVRSAQQAEALGYDSAWVAERLLYPLKPRTPYPGMPEGSLLPEYYRYVFQPVETLTWVAAHTKRIRIGTGVLNMPYHNPVILARRLATLDVFSGGRLNVGLGQAWSHDELEAAGATTAGRAERADEFIAVLRAMWGPDPVEHHGRHFQVPASIIAPKPVQQPTPPIYLAGYVPGALDRVARLADGWLPAGVPLAGVGAMMGQVRQRAEAAGRDPAAVALIMMGFVALADTPLGDGRADFTGTLDEIRRDVEAARAIGVDELILIPDATAHGTADAYLRVQEAVRPLV